MIQLANAPRQRTPDTLQPDLPAVLPKLTVEHNHGVMELENAIVYFEGKYRYVEGTVTGGGQTARLFSATHYTPFKKGHLMSWIIGSSRIRLDGDKYHVSACFCG